MFQVKIVHREIGSEGPSLKMSKGFFSSGRLVHTMAAY
jgi:hypothetical protein